MTHLLGALLIAAASAALGFSYVNGEKRRLCALRSAEQMLKTMAGELETRLTPLPELISQLACRCDGAAAVFAEELNLRLCQLGERAFSTLWAESVEAAFHILSGEERELLSTLGLCLGRYELERQLTELSLTLDQLSRAIDRHSAALPEKKRLSLGLAWAGGALLVIVLI